MKLWRLLRNKIKSPKPKWATLCREVYVDREGRRYYQYQDEGDMSIYRKGAIEVGKMELRYGVDYADVLNGIEKALNNPNRKSGKVMPDITTAGYLIHELIDRKDILLIPDILFKLCANTLIREDENPYLIDEEILEQKLITFRAEIQRGGLHAFFQVNDLLKLIGLSGISISDFNRLMTGSQDRVKQVQAQIQLFTSEQKSPGSYSSKTDTTSKKEPQRK